MPQEEAIQVAIVGYLRLTLPHGWIVQHTANKPRSKVAGSREKRLGAIAGWPDIAIYGPGSVHFFEVKAPKGRASDVQLDVHDKLLDLGHPVAIVRSLDDVNRYLTKWELPCRIKIAGGSG